MGLVDVAADTAHLISIVKQRLVARTTGSPNLSIEPGTVGLPPRLEDLKELGVILFGPSPEEVEERPESPPTAPAQTPT